MFSRPLQLSSSGAIRFVARSEHAPTAGVYNIVPAAEVRAGDLAVLIAPYSNGFTLPPSGWQRHVGREGANSFSNYTAALFKKLSAADLLGFSFPESQGANGGRVVMLVYRNAQSVVFRKSVFVANTPSMAVAGFTKRSSTRGLILVATGQPTGGGSISFGLPAGVTPRGGSFTWAAGPFSRSAVVADNLLYGAYAGGGYTVTGLPNGFAQAHVLEIVGITPTPTIETTSSLPSMTSDSSPVGHTAFGDGASLSHRAFDASSEIALGATWLGNQDGLGGFTSTQVGRSYPAPIAIGRYGIALPNTEALPTQWTLQGMVEGSYIDLHYGPGGALANTINKFDVPKERVIPATQHRLQIHQGAGQISMSELFLYRAT